MNGKPDEHTGKIDKKILIPQLFGENKSACRKGCDRKQTLTVS